MNPNGAMITLTGFMGTGKSAVGQQIAARLQLPFFDTDSIIVSEHGPISEIFASHGEDHFRALEREVVGRIALQDGVVATGGGTLLDPLNVQTLSNRGPIYTLTASAQEIVARVTGDGVATRPLLDVDDPHARVDELLAERAPVYGMFPSVRTDGRAPEAIANEIINDAANRGVIAPPAEQSTNTATGNRQGRGRIIAAVLLIGLVLIGGVLFTMLSGGEDAAGRAQVAVRDPHFDQPDGAPVADRFFDVVGVNEPAPEAESEIRDRFGFGGGFMDEGRQEVVGGSVFHVATVGSSDGPVDFYSWAMVGEFPGEPMFELTCIGRIEGNNTSSSCGGANDGPMMMWDAVAGPGGFVTRIGIANAPADAVWMTTESQTGFVAASVVDGAMAYTELDGFDGEPREIILYDADLNVVWNERLF